MRELWDQGWGTVTAGNARIPSITRPTYFLSIVNFNPDLEEMASRGSSAERISEWVEEIWDVIVNHYTPRKLSVLTDRILAISGIAEVFGSHMKDEYLAGLRKSTLPSFLCWQVTSAEHERFPRPTEHQGPSWSWIGINGPVDFILARACSRDCRATLLDADIKLVHPCAKYGPVEYGILTLKGRLREATWHRDTLGVSLKPGTGENSTASDSKEATMMTSVTMIPDMKGFEDRTGVSNSIDVSLFEIGNCVSLKRRGPVGLVLHATPHNATRSCPRFTRLGLFHIDPRSKGRMEEDRDNSGSIGTSPARDYVGLFERAPQQVIEIE